MGIIIGGIVLLLVMVLVGYIATRPDTFVYERSAVINAPAEIVFGLINDFQQWGKWSPWEKKDPNLKRSYSGPAAGPGAVYGWVGNKDVGEGRMTLLDSKAPEFVSIRLEFFKPFAADNQVRFTLTPEAGGTRVHWSMQGKNVLIGKLIGLVLNMDKMVGSDFEKGLADMNRAAQAEALAS